VPRDDRHDQEGSISMTQDIVTIGEVDLCFETVEEDGQVGVGTMFRSPGLRTEDALAPRANASTHRL